MLRKIGAVVVMILAAVGTLLCLAALFGAWSVNEPATAAVTGTLETADEYLVLAEETTTQLDNDLEAVQSRLATVATTAPEQIAQVQATLVQEVTPILGRVSNTALAVSQGLNSINATLTQLDRLPRVDVPSYDEQLQSLDARISDMAAQLVTISDTLASPDLDGERVIAAAETISQQVEEAQAQLAAWTTRIAETRATTAAVQSAAPGLLDMASWLVTLLFLLLGAGQVSLFLHALGWFRQPAT